MAQNTDIKSHFSLLPKASPWAATSLGVISLVVIFLSASCRVTPPRNANFRERPDSVAMGKLSGPFSGQVTDASTGDPVAGALVYGTWTFLAPNSASQPAGFQEAVGSTDANGRYKLSLPKHISNAKLSQFHLVIYKRGYIGYRSDRRFSDFGPSLNFTQTNHVVSLQRWNSELSHARHLRYIGGGAAINALTRWEVEEAVAEQSGSLAPPSTGISAALPDSSQPILSASQLLASEEIKAITGFEGTFEKGPLNGEADTDAYSSQHFKAKDQLEIYDLALRLWHWSPEVAEEQYTKLSESLPGVSHVNEVADKSFLALEGDIQGYAFWDKERSIVVLISCGKGQCPKVEQLKEIASKIYSNMAKPAP